MAQHVKKRLKKEGIYLNRIWCVFSEEMSDLATMQLVKQVRYKRSYYGTISYMPALFGIHISGFIIRRLCALHKKSSKPKPTTP
jgi:tRNA A37 threonylcarbamoyladenosine dehydratase